MHNHLPYREWIFEEDSLPADRGRELRLHLQECKDCKAVAERWDAAKQLLEDAGMQAPRNGFPARWKALAAERIRTPSPRWAWVLLAASSFGSLLTALTLAAQTSTRGFSLAGVFSRDLSAAVGTIEDWVDTSNALGGFLSILSQSIPAACYLLAVFFLSLTGVLWLLMLIRAKSQGRK